MKMVGLLKSGIDWLERYTGKPVFGVLAYFKGLHVDAVDAIFKIRVSSRNK